MSGARTVLAALYLLLSFGLPVAAQTATPDVPVAEVMAAAPATSLGPAATAGETTDTATAPGGALSEREKRERLARALMLLAAPGGRPFPQLSR